MARFLLASVAIVGLSFVADAWTVRTSEGCPPWERSAADILRTTLEKRATSAIRVDGKDAVVFHVGETEFAKEHGLAGSSFADEEWAVRSFGKDVVLSGGGTRGALYAVSHFLEDVCGVRFWNDDDTDVPVDEVLMLPKLDLRGRPAFRCREIYRGCDKRYTSAFAVLRRLNRNGGVPIPVEFGGAVDYGPPYSCHTFDLYVPWAKYGKEHPEWFSLSKGKRCGGRISGQLCLSQPEVRRLLKEGVLANIALGEKRAKAAGMPTPRLYDLSQNDSGAWCECPQCKAAVEEYGHSGFYLTAVNEVAEAVAKSYPDVFVTTLAYHYTEDLPKKGVRPRDNVVVRLCDTRSNQAAPITDPCNRKWYELVTSWGKVAKNLMIWDYAIVFDNPSVFFPLPTERTLAETYRTFHENHVLGVFLEHEHSDLVDLFDLKFYLESQFMEDPYRDSPTLVADAFARYFGAAAPAVTEARDILEACRRKGAGYVIYHPRTADYDFLTRGDAEKMKVLFDRAEEAVAHDPKCLRRVRRARRSADEIFRVRQTSFDPATLTVSWPPEAIERNDSSLLSLVDDADSPTGRALRIAAPNTEFHPAFGFEMYDAPAHTVVAEGKLAAKDKDGYVWDEFKGVKVPTTENSFVYFTRSWTARLRLCHPDLNGKTGTLRVLSRTEGPVRYVARVEFVCEPNRFPFEVVLPENPRPWERAAAKELESFLPRCARTRLTVDGVPRVKFHIGDTFLSWEKDSQSTMLPEGEWVVKSYGRDVLLSGGGPRGAMDAVLHFLQDVCGVRFGKENDTVVPESDVLDLPSLDLRGTTTVLPACMTANRPSRTTLIAHRGESCDAPENTLPAYETAVARGFGFECDIYLSGDKRLFAFHDGNLARTTAGANTNRCTEVDWETVSKLNVGGWGKWKGSKFDPTRPALFSEVLALARDGRTIYVEVKGDDPSWVRYIKEEVARAKNVNPSNLLFITFGERLCAELKRQMPEYKAFWLVGGTKPTLEHLLAKLEEIGADGLDVYFDQELIDSAFVRAIRDAGYEFHVWTVDDPERAEVAFSVGAQTVTTNRAKFLLETYLGK